MCNKEVNPNRFINCTKLIWKVSEKDKCLARVPTLCIGGHADWLKHTFQNLDSELAKQFTYYILVMSKSYDLQLLVHLYTHIQYGGKIAHVKQTIIWHTCTLLCNGNMENQNNLAYNNLKLIIWGMIFFLSLN
jgi:hypothetical protein